MLALSSWEASFSGMTVARKPVHRGEHEVNRKPLRGEGRSVSAEPVCSCACSCALCTRDRGCSAHPVFPAPSTCAEGEMLRKPRASHAARMRTHILTLSRISIRTFRHPRLPRARNIPSDGSRGRPIRCHPRRVQSSERPGAGVVIRSLQADAERRGSPGRLSEPNIVKSGTAGPAQS